MRTTYFICAVTAAALPFALLHYGHPLAGAMLAVSAVPFTIAAGLAKQLRDTEDYAEEQERETAKHLRRLQEYGQEAERLRDKLQAAEREADHYRQIYHELNDETDKEITRLRCLVATASADKRKWCKDANYYRNKLAEARETIDNYAKANIKREQDKQRLIDENKRLRSVHHL